MIEKVSSPVKIFIPFFDRDLANEYLKLAALLRKNGIGAEVYPEPKKLGQQLKYADRKGFAIALILGSGELEKNVIQVKNLKEKSQADVPLSDGGAELLDYLTTIG